MRSSSLAPLWLAIAVALCCVPFHAIHAQAPAAKPAAGNWEKLTMVAFRDAQGTVIAEAPFPSGWNVLGTVRPGEASITGPDGVKIMDQPGQSFIFTQDPRMRQIYQQSGQRVRPWPGPDRMVQEDFVPALSQQGWRLLRSYEVPEVSRVDRWYNDQLFKAVPMQVQVIAVGSDWEKDADGSRAFMITHVQVSNTAQLQTWYYSSSVLKAAPEHFETARKQYIFSLANTRHALGPIMAYNEAEAQKAGQSWAAHRQRMAQNQANFEQQQRNFVNKSNAINAAIMNGWRERNAASDRQQERFVDTINERTQVVDPGTGQQYKVDSHYNQYWRNSSGDFISTNQTGYNPNLDENMNNERWQQLQQKAE